MLTPNEAFQKFRVRLRPTEKQDKDASRRQQEIRGVMDENFMVKDSFLTGSYRRWTKTKPLKDVDIFCVLHDEERKAFRDGKGPAVLLDKVEQVMVKKYGRDRVHRQRRSICVEFPNPTPNDEERVMSFDVVTSFTQGKHYEIPDERNPSGWTQTDPKVHAEKATAAHAAYSSKWKGMVRMLKAWNNENDKPVKPSFLLEVMALKLLHGGFGGDYPREFMQFFASAQRAIHEDWPDPAGLGPPVSDSMDLSARSRAENAFREAQHAIRQAINLSGEGRTGEALQVYQDLFGRYFSKT